MAENNTSNCEKCGAPLVPAKEDLKLDATLKLDGSWNFGNMICPKCHPDLAKSE